MEKRLFVLVKFSCGVTVGLQKLANTTFLCHVQSNKGAIGSSLATSHQCIIFIQYFYANFFQALNAQKASLDEKKNVSTEEAVKFATELIQPILGTITEADFHLAVEEHLVDDDLETVIANYNAIRPLSKSYGKKLPKLIETKKKNKAKQQKATTTTTTTTTAAVVEDELDANQYMELRQRALAQFEKAGGNAFPHKFEVMYTIPEFLAKFANLENNTKLDDVLVSVAGRIVNKRAASNKLFFYDVQGDGESMQIMTDVRSFEEGAEAFKTVNDLLRRGNQLYIFLYY